MREREASSSGGRRRELFFSNTILGPAEIRSGRENTISDVFRSPELGADESFCSWPFPVFRRRTGAASTDEPHKQGTIPKSALSRDPLHRQISSGQQRERFGKSHVQQYGAPAKSSVYASGKDVAGLRRNEERFPQCLQPEIRIALIPADQSQTL